MAADPVPTYRRMRQRHFALTEQQDLDLAAMSAATERSASAIVRAAVVKAVGEWRKRKGK